MPIPCSNPRVIGTETWGNWAARGLVMSNDGCNSYGRSDAQPIMVRAELVKARVLPDGTTWERSPVADDRRSGDSVVVAIDDLGALAQTDADAANALNAVLTLLVKVATQQGKL